MLVVESPELGDRLGMVVHAEIDGHVGHPAVPALAPDDEQRGRLLPAPVAACELRRSEPGKEPLGQRSARAPLESAREPRDRLAGDEDVPLGRVPGARSCRPPSRDTRSR